MRRIDFGLAPTPLQELPRLSALIGGGRRLFIKRDDLLGVGLGGNKIRRFAYYFGEALDTGCDVIVAGGGARSNQTIAAAVAIGRRFRHAETLCRDVAKAAQLGGYPCPVSPADVHVYFSCGRGAGCPTVKGRDAMRQMAAMEGIFLDPLFTGKAFAGLLEMAKAGAFPPKSNIVFLHTGGAVTLLDSFC